MRHRTVALALALVLVVPPSVSQAQRGRGMNGSGGRGEMMSRSLDAARFPSASQLRRFNPAELLAGDKKKLMLSDLQVASLSTLKQTINDRNAEFLARYDTLEKAYKPDPVPPPYGRDKAELNQAKVLRAMLDTVQVRRLLDIADAMSVVTDDKSRLLAAQLLMKQEADFRTLLPAPPARDYLAPPGGR